MRLVGAHNRLHAATALLLALALRLPAAHAAALTAALPSLQPPPHRMQAVGHVAGVLWVDDSKVRGRVETTLRQLLASQKHGRVVLATPSGRASKPANANIPRQGGRVRLQGV